MSIFFSRNYGDAWAGRDPRTGLGSVGLNTREPVEGRAFAYFFILRGTGPGELRYVYIYQHLPARRGAHRSLG